MLPSLDICLYSIDNLWLKERQITPIKIMKPDWRYLNCVSIGFSCPRYLQNTDWKQKYGQSKGVPKDESIFFNQHKTLSVGRVKAYGPNTCIQSNAGVGAQGSPVFNELGRCWGILIGSHHDVPPKSSNEPLIPDAKALKQAH